MKIYTVNTEWDLGLNGSEIGENYLGIYLNEEDREAAVKDAYIGLMGDEAEYHEMVAEGLINYNEMEI